MADHLHQQKIYPVSQDVEAAQPPTAPLMPSGFSKSDREDDPVEQQPQPQPQQQQQPPPPFQRTIPVVYSKPPKKRSCFCRCLCWTLSLLLILIVVLGIIVGILYLVFQPKLPKYSIDKLQITQFSVASNSSLEATFDVTITATNPNKKIGIYYEGGSHITVWYTSTQLCEGSLPKFYQGHQNTTVLNVELTGQTQDANALVTSVQQQEQQTGTIPLNVKVKQPVRIKLGKLKLMKLNFKVNCRLDVDSLSASSDISISDSSCDFKLDL